MAGFLGDFVDHLPYRDPGDFRSSGERHLAAGMGVKSLLEELFVNIVLDGPLQVSYPLN